MSVSRSAARWRRRRAVRRALHAALMRDRRKFERARQEAGVQ